ncbi:hypothetical protein C6I20_06710 [Aeromicrobium sp. A1-2]|uniref:metallophosphoesterase family protein n=1 Tax=Aeromicrobium sp. A1-2 TaxID=2107713 RepID=UPI000E4926FF|nr:metallophosphoesterase [Aeromicrobium sp. A1-2]AXT84910.1 hypothetical protein C6I20_06710 [Aeromicrobium sp. A1-2]
MINRGAPAHAAERSRGRGSRKLFVIAGLLLVLSILVFVGLNSSSLIRSSSDEKPATSLGQSVPTISDTPLARIAVAGDTGTGDAAEAATAERMRLESERTGHRFDALLLLGDLVYEDGDSSLTSQVVTEPFSRILEHATLIPVVGNHDVKSGEEKQIMSELGRDSSWYVQEVGPLRVIVLDSTRVDDEQQTAWLRGVLAEKQPRNTWTIVALHHSAYSSGSHGSDKGVQKAWVPLFAEARVPLVMSGHDHDYERSTPQLGVTYVVSGAGAKLRPVGRSDFTAVSTSTLHFVDLLVYDDRVEVRAINHTGGLIDQFTIKR